METPKDLLNIDNLLYAPYLNKALQELAETIMNDYCIDNGQYQYRPIDKEGLTEIKMTRLSYNFDKPEHKTYSSTYKLK